MRNAEVTKSKIIKESANLFNTQGYKATSISDITRATGYTKGAIYRHFTSKQDLEQQALRSLSKLMFDEIGVLVRQATTFQAKFEAIFGFFENYMNAPLYQGGCPLMNAAVETDDNNPVLRKQAVKMLAELKTSMTRLLDNGIGNGQVKADIDVAFYSTIFIATLEGGIMMSKLERNTNVIRLTIEHLRNIVREISI